MKNKGLWAAFVGLLASIAIFILQRMRKGDTLHIANDFAALPHMRNELARNRERAPEHQKDLEQIVNEAQAKMSEAAKAIEEADAARIRRKFHETFGVSD